MMPATLRPESTVTVPAPELAKVATSVLVVVPEPPGTPAVQVAPVQLPFVVPVHVEDVAWAVSLQAKNRLAANAYRNGLISAEMSIRFLGASELFMELFLLLCCCYGCDLTRRWLGGSMEQTFSPSGNPWGGMILRDE